MKEALYNTYEKQVKEEVILNAVADIENLVPEEEDWTAVANANSLNDMDALIAAFGEERSVELARQYAAYRFIMESAHITYRD